MRLLLTPEQSLDEHVLPVVAPKTATVLTLANQHTHKTLLFKAKTNAPARWIVRPNRGALPPGCELDLIITLLSDEPALIDDDRHLILYMPLPDDETHTFRVSSIGVGDRSPLDALHEDNTLASQVRVVPRLDAHAAAPSPHAPPPGSAASTARTTGPGSPSFASPGPLGLGGLSVAQKVAEIHRQNGGMAQGGTDTLGGVDSRPISMLERRAASLLGFVRSILGSDLFGGDLLDEVNPWFKWKLYDILWSIALLLLSSRLRWVEKIKNVLDP